MNCYQFALFRKSYVALMQNFQDGVWFDKICHFSFFITSLDNKSYNLKKKSIFRRQNMNFLRMNDI